MTQIDSLIQQYETTMTAYNQTYQDYTAAINTGYTQLPGKAYTGLAGGQVSYSTAKNADQCQGTCSKLPNCGGATFTPNQMTNNCKVSQSVNTSIPNYGISSSSGNVAIVKKSLVYAAKLYGLNEKLLSLNNQIQNAIAANPSYNVDNINGQKKAEGQVMMNEYDKLMKQRADIKKLIDEYDSINSSNINSSLVVNQQMMNYRLFIIALFFLIYIGFVVVFNIEGGFNPISFGLILSFITYFLNMSLISFTILILTIFYYIFNI